MRKKIKQVIIKYRLKKREMTRNMNNNIREWKKYRNTSEKGCIKPANRKPQEINVNENKRMKKKWKCTTV